MDELMRYRLKETVKSAAGLARKENAWLQNGFERPAQGVWCSIVKDSGTVPERVVIEQPYVIHKDTLAQIWHEIFSVRHRSVCGFFLPVVVLLEPLAVGGIKVPGCFAFSEEHQAFVFLCGISPRMRNYWLEAGKAAGLNAKLFIAYACKPSPPPEEAEINLAAALLAAGASELSRYISIHGGLREFSVITPADELRLLHDPMETQGIPPICLTQWIERT